MLGFAHVLRLPFGYPPLLSEDLEFEESLSYVGVAAICSFKVDCFIVFGE